MVVIVGKFEISISNQRSSLDANPKIPVFSSQFCIPYPHSVLKKCRTTPNPIKVLAQNLL